MLKKTWHKFIVFSFVGGSSAFVHMLFFNFFRFWLGAIFTVSLIFAIFFAVIYNFSMNRNVTFSAKHESLKKQIPRYIIIYGLSISINFIVATTTKYFLGGGVLKENIATLAGIIVSIPFSFLGSLFWVFKRKKPILVS